MNEFEREVARQTGTLLVEAGQYLQEHPEDFMYWQKALALVSTNPKMSFAVAIDVAKVEAGA